MKLDPDPIPPGAILAGVLVISSAVVATVLLTLFAVWMLQPAALIKGATWGSPARTEADASLSVRMPGAGLPARVFSAPTDGGMA